MPHPHSAGLQRAHGVTKSALYQRAEILGTAAAITKRIAESLPDQKAEGAREVLIALRAEIQRTLALAARPA